MRVPEVAAAVGTYAQRVHRLAGDGHHVASPLGAWMLLALSSTAARGDGRSRLEEVLGADAAEASAFVGGLLAFPHPLVGSGAALWTRERRETDAVAAWREGLPRDVERGELPSKGALDAWATRRTLGMIREFPVDVDLQTLLVMATVLATKAHWDKPFDTVPSAELGPSPWSKLLRRALRPPQTRRLDALIADTTGAGRVAVHIAHAAKGLRVVSVIAAREVAPLDTLAAAYDIAVHGGDPTWSTSFTRRSLFRLPLKEDPRWTIVEEPAKTTTPDGREEQYRTTLPAWSAQSRLDLTDSTVGFPDAAAAIGAAYGGDALPFDAVQATRAKYSAVGFEAASLTGLASRGVSLPVLYPGLRRAAHLRFCHPYAVVAVATAPRGETSVWQGLPVFSAWVAEPEEATDAPSDQ